jgi:hypothetical protein
MTRPLRSSLATAVTRLLCVILGGAMLATACGTAAESDLAAGAAATEGAKAKTAQTKPESANAPVERYRDVTIPSGTALALSLTSSVASDTSKVEDAVTAELGQPLIVDGRELVPAGAIVGGHVTGAENSGRVKGRAQVSFRFNTLTMRGDRYDMQTAAISRIAPATKGEDATKIGIGAGAGALIGGLLDGKEGAAKGAAVGGGAGTGVVLATKGKQMRLAPGTDVTTTLTAPLTVRVKIS